MKQNEEMDSRVGVEDERGVEGGPPSRVEIVQLTASTLALHAGTLPLAPRVSPPSAPPLSPPWPPTDDQPTRG